MVANIATLNNVNVRTDKSASKARKAKVAMMKKFVTNIGTTSKIIESSARKNEG